MRNTLIISGFPGIGKTTYFKDPGDDFIIDSDSSTFDKNKFPENYITHIKKYIGQVDIILMSSHKEVREALHAEGIDFSLVYPERSRKAEFLQRYKDRGSPEAFITLLDDNWDAWITECENDTASVPPLAKGTNLSDVMGFGWPYAKSFQEDEFDGMA